MELHQDLQHSLRTALATKIFLRQIPDPKIFDTFDLRFLICRTAEMCGVEYLSAMLEDLEGDARAHCMFGVFGLQ